jgi:hypothetical protein
LPTFLILKTTVRHASQGKDSQHRVQALSQSLASLHQLFSKSQDIINIAQRLAFPANQPQAYELDIVICTTQDYHLLNQLPLPEHFYKHHSTKVEPLLLGFECQAVLRDYLGQYDYYCFLEDDLILHDPWFFVKLNWFSQQAGELSLLQPNRYEVCTDTLTYKAYIDGDLCSTDDCVLSGCTRETTGNQWPDYGDAHHLSSRPQPSRWLLLFECQSDGSLG